MDEEIEYYKSISCDWLARLLGIIDGDGYVSVVKSNLRPSKMREQR
jgi:hypothetical protein